MNTAIRTLRPETGKRGRPKAPHHPSSAASSQKDLNAPIPKELGLPYHYISCKDGLNKGQKWYGPNRSRRY